MTKAARTSFGSEFRMGPAGGTLVAVAELYRIGQPQVQRATEDATTHDSVGNADEFLLLDTIDPGELTIEGYYIMGSAGDTALLAAVNAPGATALRDFSVTAKGAGTTKGPKTFSGFVTSYQPQDLEIKGKQTFTATIKITGPVTQGVPA